MSWIESHQSLSRHTKTLDVADLLSISRHEVIGLLMDLWWWGLDSVSSNGFMGNISDKKIAVAAQWDGDATEFTKSLITAGFIDEKEDGRWLHDWYDYAGKLLVKREKDSERKRMSREIPTDVQRMSNGQNSDVQRMSARTVPYLTIPNNTTTKERGVGELATAFQQTFGRFMNSVQQADLFEYMDKGMEVDLMIDAMRTAARNNKPFSYALSIIKRRHDDGITSLEQAERVESERQAGIQLSYTVRAGPPETVGRYIPRGLAPEVIAALEEDERERQRAMDAQANSS